MDILINGTLAKPHIPDAKYQGIERLSRDFAIELNRLGHKVTVTAPAGSVYPEGIKVVEMGTGMAEAEQTSFVSNVEFVLSLRTFDVIHDFSHSHCPGIADFKLPTLNVFWHDPMIAQFPEPQKNVIALSNYAAERFREVYQQECRVQETIIVDPNIYHADGAVCEGGYLSLGVMLPIKGHLEAMRLARKADVRLSVVGGRGVYDPPGYEDLVRSLCANDIKFLGEVSDAHKVDLMRESAALIYPQNQLEIHSHKSCEAMACGCPVITWDIGAMKEIIGDAGFVVKTEEEFLAAIKAAPNFNVCECIDRAERWHIQKVVGDYVELYEEVANGLRW